MVEREELLPLAYIFTVVAVFQGVSIYVVLVLLTKNVRDKLINWAISKRELMVRSRNYIIYNISLVSLYYTGQELCNI